MKTWTDKAERGNACLIQLIVWLALTAGRTFCRTLLYPIVFYFLVTDGTARRSSAEFLRMVRGRPARTGEVFSHIYSFAMTLLDRVYMANNQFDRFEITIENRDLVDRALASERGCVLLGSHLGSFDMMMFAMRTVDPRALSIMMRVDPRARLRRIAGIDDSMVDIIPLGTPNSFLRAHEVLTTGGIVATLADRTEGAPAILASFLGRPVLMPVAPHILAARSSAPVLACFGLYEGGNRYTIKFVEFGPAAPPTGRGKELEPFVAYYANLLEQHARLYPLNWFNFYPFWDEQGKET